ncbi:dTDP-4-dehydrorhamnose reductase [Limnoglobus roseus]|uniref:dTDP-4-dehydrorhamnose reductase n=1 Tax=Limnoglobus roseus TaxID=2598579 RepID=A0A5C1ABG9_9BACT|nr:dTDP-4-dehydrorhamnose reductase [Limnoglobus roseus]QEL15513.1 dTDP-4-dehydrorhamnose reductase [Limnoglobus roseus]
MKTLVLGSAGQLGRDLVPLLPGEVVPLTRADADFAKPGSLAAVVKQHAPDAVVNCAAYNLVDKAEVEPDVAFAVNAWGVRELAAACCDANAKLVHVSTDYVFGLDASRDKPFTEDDAPGPVSVYGLSKLAGEYVVRATAPKHIVVRTCGLYGVWGSGGKGGNFVETMLRVAGQGKPLRVVNDQFCTPSYTKDVAAMIAGLMAADAHGLFHATNAGSCTWYELAAEIFRQAGVTADLSTIRTAERNDPAKRPPYSVLSTAKLAAVGVPAPRSWQEALAAYLSERKNRQV